MKRLRNKPQMESFLHYDQLDVHFYNSLEQLVLHWSLVLDANPGNESQIFTFYFFSYAAFGTEYSSELYISNSAQSIRHTIYKHLNQNPPIIWNTTGLQLWLVWTPNTDRYIDNIIITLLARAGTFSNRLWERQLSYFFFHLQVTDWEIMWLILLKYFSRYCGLCNQKIIGVTLCST